MAGGFESRVYAGSSPAAADHTSLLEDTGPYEVAIVSLDGSVVAGPTDAAVPFVLIAAKTRWSRPAGYSETNDTPWNWSGTITRKGPWVSQQICLVSGVFSVSMGHFVFLKVFLELPLHSLGIYDSYQSIPTKFPGDPLLCADVFFLGFIPSLRSSALSWHAEADRSRSGLLYPHRLQIRAEFKSPSAPNSAEIRGKKTKLFHKNPGQTLIEKVADPERGRCRGRVSQCFKVPLLDDAAYQIFLRTTEGRHLCLQIWGGMRVLELKEKIQDKLGIPVALQNLIFSGVCLQDHLTLQHFRVAQDSTITLNHRLRGGSKGSSSKPTGTYRDAAKGKAPAKGKEPAVVSPSPGQYIVDQIPESPSIALDLPEVQCIFSNLEKKAVICRFNGFWPKTEALYEWIHTIWTKNCQIHLCSKGFFIVIFLEVEEKEKILNEGPWFWGSAGLFVTPWFPEFDANTTVVSRMPVWVRLHNLPLHFWHFRTLTAIGNTLGKMLKIDTDRHLKGIFTFARICVEVDLSQGLPESIFLKFNNTQWKQPLDYENTAFRCRGCQQIGHLLKACPSKSKPQQRKPRGWQNLDEVLNRRTARKKAPSVTEEEETEAEEDDITTEEFETENQKENSAANKDPQPHSNQVETQNDKTEMKNVDQNSGGNKRQDHSDTSNSDKETGQMTDPSQLVIVSTEPTLGEWRKVEKKKGRKT